MDHLVVMHGSARSENERLKEENATLRQRVKEQDEFIQSMKSMIADFVYGENRGRSLGRHMNGG